MQNVELATKRLDDIQRRGLHGWKSGRQYRWRSAWRSKFSRFTRALRKLGLLVLSMLHPAGVSASVTQGARSDSGVSARDRRWRRPRYCSPRAREISAAQRLLSHGEAHSVDRTPDRVCLANAAPWSKAITQAPSETLKRFCTTQSSTPPPHSVSGRSSGKQTACRRLGLSLRIRQPAPELLRLPRLATFHSTDAAALLGTSSISTAGSGVNE